jgi:hypothetical protein
MVYIRKWVRLGLCALAAALLLQGAAHAAVLYSQTPLNGGDAFEAQYSIAGVFGTQNADSFTLSGPSIVTGFRWWGTAVSNTNAFVARHFDDVVSAPNAFNTLSGTITSTPTLLTDSSGSPIFQFDLQLGSALPLSGTDFFSVFLNSDSPWFWLESAEGNGVSAFRGVEGDAWSVTAPDLAFAVVGELQTQQIAEPSALLLFVIAAAAALFNRRRRLACAS